MSEGRRRGLTAMIAASALLIAGCTADAPENLPSGDRSGVLGDDATRSLVEALPEAPSTGISLERLADGLVPPTNTWFSGLVFGDAPNPVFPLPLSFALTENGVDFGVPTVVSSPGAIAAPHAPQVLLQTGTDTATVTRYDEVSVTIALSAGADTVAEVTIARGSPIVSYVATTDHEVRLSAPLTPGEGEGVHVLETEGGTFALVAPEADVLADGTTVSVPAGASANWIAVPEGVEPASVTQLAASPLTGVEVLSTVDGGGVATTTLRYVTADGSPTAIGRLPHHGDARGGADEDCSLGSVLTTYGPLALCAGTELVTEAPAVEPSAALDLSSLDADDAAEVLDAVEADVRATGDLPVDSYFGGKALARLATLLQLTRQLTSDEAPEETRATAAELGEGLASRLTEELTTWMSPTGCDERDTRCFTYDPELGGIVGREASFGADEFNDHHFHYGYFLYAAAVLAGATGDASEGASIDNELVEQVRPVVDLLAADIASGGGELFPTRRAFDPYSGHSWASGFSPFTDGNNQESSSEAVTAYNGLALWAQATGDEPLEGQARWMLAAESHSALAYWTGFDRDAEPYAGYDRGSVGIVWDGKRDFSTWFAPEPEAVLGIQLIPMHPIADYLLGDEQRILDNIAEVSPGGAGEGALFADYLLMYQALAGSEQAAEALEAARALPEEGIDDGNSRAYLLAFILSRR